MCPLLCLISFVDLRSVRFIRAVISVLFSLLNRIPLCGDTEIRLSILLLDVWVVFSLGLLQVKLSITFLNDSLCGRMFSFLLDTCPE